MSDVSLVHAQWRKSSRSNTSGDCVEVAHLRNLVGVRDSKDPDGAVLVFGPSEWATFIDTVKDDQFGV